MNQSKTENWNIDRLSSQKVIPIIKKSLFVLGIIIFWCWNWKLLLAIIVGIGLMLLVYLTQSRHWDQYWRICKRLLTGYNRKLALAVSSGGVGAFMTYMIVSIWADTENRWLATGSILQGLGTLATLFILGWHFWGEPNHEQEARFNQLSQDLTNVDPLKRLMAIRQLTVLVSDRKLPHKYYEWLIEYYQLMLSQPQENLVREALLDGLEALDVSLIRESRKQPIPIALNRTPSRKPIYKSY